MTKTPYGFRIVGSCRNPRKLIDWSQAFTAYCGCYEVAQVDKEAYLSAFQYGNEFRQHLTNTRSTRDYRGPCWASWLWLDIDREADLQQATRDAGRLVASIIERYQIDDEALLTFFSGAKGFHIGLPTSLWNPQPSEEFNKVAGRFAEQLAEQAGINIDTGVYDKVRPFRAPNSRHPKTGLFKRHLNYDELLNLQVSKITALAKQSEEFDLPLVPLPSDQAKEDWQQAESAVRQMKANRKPRSGNQPPNLNRQTLDFIRCGASEGERANRLYNAALNLAEFDCPRNLAHALLTESARDSGLPPSEILREIDCGLAARSRQ